jgi:hypothetical protein
VLGSENLAATWSTQAFKSFVSELAEAVEVIDEATNASDVVEAVDAWRELLGDDFPTLPSDALGIQLGDYSHAQNPAQKGWIENPDPRFQVRIEATREREKHGRVARPVWSDGEPVFAGNRFNIYAKNVPFRP